MSEPDLFVVCKNCSSEVSPYVTECPYCGQRVRKRAPRLGREGAVEPKQRRTRAPSLPRLRGDEIPGISAELRPYAVWVLVAVAVAAAVVLSTGELFAFDLGGLTGPIDGEWWRVAATPFVHENVGYLLVAMVATAIFGAQLEMRFGRIAVVAIFLLSGAAGAALAAGTDLLPALGANGAALGLLCAWLVDDRRSLRRGDDRESDLIGVYVFGAVLFLLSVAEETASIAAAVGGAGTGALSGLALSSLKR